MSANEIIIEAEPRSTRGKGDARKLRRAGKIPANVLDKGKATAITIDPKYLSKIYQTESRTFQLKLDGATKQAKIHELQIHPVKRLALHVDFVYA